VPTSRKTSRSWPLNVSVSSWSRQSVGSSRSRLGLKIKCLGLGPQGLVYIPEMKGDWESDPLLRSAVLYITTHPSSVLNIILLCNIKGLNNITIYNYVTQENQSCNCIPLIEDVLIGKSAAVSVGIWVASHSRDLFISSNSHSGSKLPDDTERHNPLCLCLLQYKFITRQIILLGVYQPNEGLTVSICIYPSV